MLIAFLFLLLGVSLSPTEALADDGNLKVSGYIKGFFTELAPPPIDDPLERSAFFRLRLKASWEPNDNLGARIAYEMAPRIEKRRDLFSDQSLPRPAPLSYQAFDFRPRLYTGKDDSKTRSVFAHNLDRAFITFSWAIADLSLGRQPVAFGGPQGS